MKNENPFKNTIDLLNKSTNKNLIKIKANTIVNYNEDKETMLKSPICGTYFIIEDLSINLNINFKWCLYGYFFMISISQTINNVYETYHKDIFSESIEKNYKINKNEHIILFDKKNVNDEEFFLKLINDNFYQKINKNTIISLKLKINIHEFIILQNTSHPELIFL